MIAQACRAGVASLTMFETAGPEGVTEFDEGSPYPAKFPSRAGHLYTLGHALASIQRSRDRANLFLEVEGHQPIEGFAYRSARGLEAVIANLTPEGVSVPVRLPESAGLGLRIIDEESGGDLGAISSVDRPRRVRSRPGPICRRDHQRHQVGVASSDIRLNHPPFRFSETVAGEKRKKAHG